MSAALQLPMPWETCKRLMPRQVPVRGSEPALVDVQAVAETPAQPPESLAFYRRHAERMLRRYLYASMQVGRAPSILSDPVGRGWVSSRRVRTFEDAVIFVLDVEKCLNRLCPLDQQLLARIVLQEYTQAEAAALLGMSTRAVSYKFHAALDRLTEQLLEADLLILPD